MNYYHYLVLEILLLIMAIPILRTQGKEQERLEKLGIEYIDCGTSGGVYGLDRGYCLMVGGSNIAVSTCAPIFRALAPGIGVCSPELTHSQKQPLLSMVGYIAEVLEQVTL